MHGKSIFLFVEYYLHNDLYTRGQQYETGIAILIMIINQSIYKSTFVKMITNNIIDVLQQELIRLIVKPLSNGKSDYSLMVTQ